MLFIPGINRFRRDDNKKVVVTGCGRSGTLYMSKVLMAIGIDVGHEGFMTDGISSWYIVEKTRASKIAEMTAGLDCSYIHLVRNPLDAISSMMRCELARDRSALDFFARTHPQYNDLDIIERCARYWVEWNLEVDNNYPIDLRLRVDDMPGYLDELCLFLGVDAGDPAKKYISDLGEECHTLTERTKEGIVKNNGPEVLRTVTLDECGSAGEDVKRLAEIYNYKI